MTNLNEHLGFDSVSNFFKALMMSFAGMAVWAGLSMLLFVMGGVEVGAMLSTALLYTGVLLLNKQISPHLLD